jgi:hypothetical protein
MHHAPQAVRHSVSDRAEVLWWRRTDVIGVGLLQLLEPLLLLQTLLLLLFQLERAVRARNHRAHTRKRSVHLRVCACACVVCNHVPLLLLHLLVGCSDPVHLRRRSSRPGSSCPLHATTSSFSRCAHRPPSHARTHRYAQIRTRRHTRTHRHTHARNACELT